MHNLVEEQSREILNPIRFEVTIP